MCGARMTEQPALFDLQPQRGPTEPIVRTAAIEGVYRWSLTRAWGSGPCLVWCGLNPSTADDKKDDPTLKREMRFSFLWGYGSLVKLNFYPFRSSTTGPLFEWVKQIGHEGPAQDAWMKNLNVVANTLRDTACDRPMAVWGNGVDPDRLKEFLAFSDLGAVTPQVDARIVSDQAIFGPIIRWHCLELTKSGAPRHTLARGKHRVPDTQQPTLWRTA